MLVICGFGFREGHTQHAFIRFATLVRGNDSHQVSRDIFRILTRKKMYDPNQSRKKPELISMCSTFKPANKMFITIGSYVNVALFALVGCIDLWIANNISHITEACVISEIA